MYDCTAITRGNRHQMLYFKMADELRRKWTYQSPCTFLIFYYLEVELQILRLKLIQFPNGRHQPHTSQCTFAIDHPVCLEPSFNCGNERCVTCRVVHETRGFVNACYEAQHRVCSNAEVQGKNSSVGLPCLKNCYRVDLTWKPCVSRDHWESTVFHLVHQTTKYQCQRYTSSCCHTVGPFGRSTIGSFCLFESGKLQWNPCVERSNQALHR